MDEKEKQRFRAKVRDVLKHKREMLGALDDHGVQAALLSAGYPLDKLKKMLTWLNSPGSEEEVLRELEKR